MLNWFRSGLVVAMLATVAGSASGGPAFATGAEVIGAVQVTTLGATGAAKLSGIVPPGIVQTQIVAANTAEDITKLPPPIASPFIWSATKGDDGSVSFAGFVPNQDVRLTLTDAVGKIGADTTAVASGEPDGFAARAVAALDILADLDSGKVAFDGGSWSVTGKVDSVEKATTASAAFAASPLKDVGTGYQVDAPVAAASAPAATTPVAATPTAVAPAAATSAATTSTPAASTAATATPPATASSGYAWSAEKNNDGSVVFTGSVPDAGLKAFLARHVAGKLTDNSAIAADAPAGYLSDVVLGLKALEVLNSGKLAFADGKWSLSGSGDEAAKTASTTALSLVDPKAWKIDVTTQVATTPATTATPVPSPSASATPPATASTTPATATTPAAPAYTFTATKSSAGVIALSGDVPDSALRGSLGDLAGNAPTASLKIVANPPANFVNGAVGGLGVLRGLDNGQLNFDGEKWSLKGAASSPDARDNIIASLGRRTGGDAWSLDIAGPPPAVVCQLKLADAAAAGNGIDFAARTAFAKGTDAALDSIATLLSSCPDARVNVEGFTDTDGDANANMALSVARAEAVVDALVKRGVKPSRLYAVGYGETLPLVPNTTKANKAKNRRIDFKVGDGPQ